MKTIISHARFPASHIRRSSCDSRTLVVIFLAVVVVARFLWHWKYILVTLYGVKIPGCISCRVEQQREEREGRDCRRWRRRSCRGAPPGSTRWSCPPTWRAGSASYPRNLGARDCISASFYLNLYFCLHLFLRSGVFSFFWPGCRKTAFVSDHSPRCSFFSPTRDLGPGVKYEG